MTVLVSQENLSKVIELLCKEERLSLDTETEGLEPFHGDRTFSYIIGSASDEYYFNFNVGGFNKDAVLPEIQKVVDSVKYLFFVNFDYDYTMARLDGVVIDKPKILDGGVLARLENSAQTPTGSKADNQFFSLDYLAKHYLKKEKDSTVEKHIKDNDLYGLDRHGKKKPLYKKVPLDVMFKYGCSDARITFDVCTEIIRRINARDVAYESSRPKSWPKIMDVLANESKLSTALAATKFRGMLLDTSFCERARVYELETSKTMLEEIKKTVDLNVNSPKQVSTYLMETLKLTLPKIIKRGKWTGGYSTDAKTLDALAEKHDLPVLQKIVTAKRSQKKANTYYKNYLLLKDAGEVIHCSLGQETTLTGRLSSFQPNLQNIHKEKYHEYAVRNAFTARKGFKLFFLDYKGQEMYIMIDLSGDSEVIELVENGKDIYIAMAEIVKRYTGIEITRNQAKALALGVAYGQGVDLIASNLGCTKIQAKKLKGAFVKSLKGVAALDKWAKAQAERYHKVHNPYGRVTQIDRGFEYKTLNALIQGTAADCTKKAFIDCYEFLKPHKSKVWLTVHDEIIFEVADDETHLVNDLKNLMTRAYPHRTLPLRVDVEVSETTWAAKVDYAPQSAEVGLPLPLP